MTGPPLDDASPISLQRHMILGYPTLSSLRGPYWATTEGGTKWLITREVLVEFPEEGEPGVWPLILVGYLALEHPLDCIVVVAGVEQRVDLGIVTALAEETFRRR